MTKADDIICVLHDLYVLIFDYEYIMDYLEEFCPEKIKPFAVNFDKMLDVNVAKTNEEAMQIINQVLEKITKQYDNLKIWTIDYLIENNKKGVMEKLEDCEISWHDSFLLHNDFKIALFDRINSYNFFDLILFSNKKLDNIAEVC